MFQSSGQPKRNQLTFSKVEAVLVGSKVEAALGDHRAELQSPVLASEQLLLPAADVGLTKEALGPKSG